MIRGLLLAVTITLAAAAPARAQGQFAMWPEPVDGLIREALDTPYAQAQLRTFAAAVRSNGDPACLQAKALDDAATIAAGRALLQRYGVQMMKIVDENFDRAAYEAALSASAGPKAIADIERLKRDPDVKRFTALYRPARLAKIVDIVVENFDRYVLVGRIKLDPIGPIPRGETLKEDPTEAAEAAAQRFVDQRRSPRLHRYLDLMEADEAARPKGLRKETASKLGPMAYFAGVERDLAELCIGRR